MICENNKKTPSSEVLFKPLVSLLLACCLLLASVQSVRAEGFKLNMRNTDIGALVELVARITGENFVLDKSAMGRKITIISNREIDEQELYDLFLSVLNVHQLSAIKVGKVTKIVPANKSKQLSQPVVAEEELKNKPEKRKPDELITTVIKVKHVPVNQLAPILRPLASPTGHMQPYVPSNSILVSDTAANVAKINALIASLDRPDQDEMEVVQLRFASAPELVKAIQGLNGVAAQKGVISKYKVSADNRTNSILVSGSKSSRAQVKDIIRRLDRPKAPSAEGKRQTRVVYLRYAKAEELAKVLEGTSKGEVSAEATAKGGAGTQKAETTIYADAATNSLVITAEPEIHRNLLEVVRRLDVRRAQVMVEAIIAEVSEDLSKALGIQLGLFNSGGGTTPVLSTSYPGSPFSVAEILAGSLPAGIGMLLGIGGGEAGGTQFGALMNALSSDAATNILSTPTLVTMDNVEAEMVIGQNVPFVTGSSSTNNGVTTPFQTIERQDVGISLKIKPQINAGDSIMLQIKQEVSSLAASNAGASDLVTNKRSFTTQVLVEDGQLLVLGGLMEDTYRDTIQKVPVLGDLPFIGRAFRNKTTVKAKQNLMVFIHPLIMRDVLRADDYTLQKYNRLKGAQQQSGITRRGIINNRRAADFPANPNDMLSIPTVRQGHNGGSGLEAHWQQQHNQNMQLQQRNANPRVYGYNGGAVVGNQQRQQRRRQPLTPQQRAAESRRREQIQQQQNQERRRRARLVEQQLIQKNNRRRQQQRRHNPQNHAVQQRQPVQQRPVQQQQNWEMEYDEKRKVYVPSNLVVR